MFTPSTNGEPAAADRPVPRQLSSATRRDRAVGSRAAKPAVFSVRSAGRAAAAPPSTTPCSAQPGESAEAVARSQPPLASTWTRAGLPAIGPRRPGQLLRPGPSWPTVGAAQFSNLMRIGSDAPAAGPTLQPVEHRFWEPRPRVMGDCRPGAPVPRAARRCFEPLPHQSCSARSRPHGPVAKEGQQGRPSACQLRILGSAVAPKALPVWGAPAPSSSGHGVSAEVDDDLFSKPPVSPCRISSPVLPPHQQAFDRSRSCPLIAKRQRFVERKSAAAPLRTRVSVVETEDDTALTRAGKLIGITTFRLPDEQGGFRADAGILETMVMPLKPMSTR